MRSSPGISCCFAPKRISYINLTFSLIHLSEIKPFWSLWINLGRKDFSREAITEDAIFYMTLRTEIGRQFFRRNGDLFGLGRQVIIPCLCVTDKEPILYP